MQVDGDAGVVHLLNNGSAGRGKIKKRKKHLLSTTWPEQLHAIVSNSEFAAWAADGKSVMLSQAEWEYIVLPSTELSRNFQAFRRQLLAYGKAV